MNQGGQGYNHPWAGTRDFPHRRQKVPKNECSPARTRSLTKKDTLTAKDFGSVAARTYCNTSKGSTYGFSALDATRRLTSFGTWRFMSVLCRNVPGKRSRWGSYHSAICKGWVK